MTKRAVAMLLAGAMALCLCACGKKEAEVTPSAFPTPPVPTENITPTPTPTSRPTPSTVEPSEDVELFQAFLRGETKASVDKDFRDDSISELADMEPFTIQELLQKIEENTTDEGKLAYTMMETLSGREMLVLHYMPDAAMGQYLYLVFGVFDNQVWLTYATEFGYRSYVDLCQGLVFSGAGSAGAGDHPYWCGYIGEDGHYQRVYEGRLLSASWVLMGAYDVLGEDIDWTENLWCDFVTTDEGKFYDLGASEGTDLADVDQEKLAQLRQYYTDQGYVEVEDAEAVIADALSAYNVDPDAPDVEDWTPWDIPK